MPRLRYSLRNKFDQLNNVLFTSILLITLDYRHRNEGYYLIE